MFKHSIKRKISNLIYNISDFFTNNKQGFLIIGLVSIIVCVFSFILVGHYNYGWFSSNPINDYLF